PSQTSLLMAVGRSPGTGRGREGLRRTALRACGHARVLFGHACVRRRADRTYPDLDPHPEEQLAMTTVDKRQDFKVADLSLAGFGRKEITLAEHEMPGLMA